MAKVLCISDPISLNTSQSIPTTTLNPCDRIRISVAAGAIPTRLISLTVRYLTTTDAVTIAISDNNNLSIIPGNFTSTTVIFNNAVLIQFTLPSSSEKAIIILAFEPDLSSYIIRAIDGGCLIPLSDAIIPSIQGFHICGCEFGTSTFQTGDKDIIEYSIFDISGSNCMTDCSGCLPGEDDGFSQVLVPTPPNQNQPIEATDNQKLVSPSIILNNVVITYIVNTIAIVSFWNNDRTMFRNLLIGSRNFFSFPVPPTPNQNFCTDPNITINNLMISSFNGDILEVDLVIMDDEFHDNFLIPYQHCITPANNGTRFTIFLLFVNCTLINPPTNMRVIIYAVLKLVLAMVISCELNTKWLYRCNYETLLCRVTASRYRNFIPTLLENQDLEVSFKCNC